MRRHGHMARTGRLFFSREEAEAYADSFRPRVYSRAERGPSPATPAVS